MRKDTAVSDLVKSVVQLLRKEGSRIEAEEFPRDAFFTPSNYSRLPGVS